MSPFFFSFTVHYCSFSTSVLFIAWLSQKCVWCGFQTNNCTMKLMNQKIWTKEKTEERRMWQLEAGRPQEWTWLLGGAHIPVRPAWCQWVDLDQWVTKGEKQGLHSHLQGVSSLWARCQITTQRLVYHESSANSLGLLLTSSYNLN